MATPYDKNDIGGELSLPRVYIPSWFNIDSDDDGLLLNLNLLINLNNTLMEDIEINEDCLNLKGEESFSNNSTTNHYENYVFIGDKPPKKGRIVAYSDDRENKHILIFENASLKSFKFAVSNNYVSNYTKKLYRSFDLTQIDNNNNKMIISNSDTDTNPSVNNSILTLTEGGC